MKFSVPRPGIVATLAAAILVSEAGDRAFGQLSAQDAGAMFTAFYNNFYSPIPGGGRYVWQQGGSFVSYNVWQNAEMIEMTTDRYLAAPNTTDANILTALLNGFDATYGSDWTGDQYNDDIMWSVLAHARAYLALYRVTGTINSSMSNWANIASNNFCWVYDGGHSPGRIQPQYDATFGGGMWWTTNHLGGGSKNASVNGPGALAAFYLHLIYPNAGFQIKAQNMIRWETVYLVNPDGYLYAQYDTNGPSGSDVSCNAGAYVGAAGLVGLGYPELVADYYTNYDCPKDILPNFGTSGGNNDGFNGIFLRWVGTYEFLSRNTNWYGFFDNQAKAAWAVANASGLSWDCWQTNTPDGGLYSWGCSPSVSALQWAQISRSATAPLAPLQESVTITNAGNGQMKLNWIYGTLQTATNLAGPYTSVPGASPPCAIPMTESAQFYRVLEN